MEKIPKIRIYNFRKLANKVLSHMKQITIRKVRKRESQVNDTMHPYIVFYPGEATITKIVRKKLKDITLEEALADGFDSTEECIQGISEMHADGPDQADIDWVKYQEFDLTYFKPHWRPLKIVSLYDLNFIIKRLEKAKNKLDIYPRSELDSIYDMLIELINKEDPRVDMRSLDLFFDKSKAKI